MSSRSLNKVLLIGNLTRDPELRYTPQGTAVCTIGLATNRSWTSPEGGERNEETEFHRLVAWSKLAEICGQLLKKGRKIYVEGRLQTRKWTAQDGAEKQTTEIVMDNMILLDSRGAGEGAGDASAYAYPADDSASKAAPTASAKPAAAKKGKKSAKTEETVPAEPVVAEDISDDIPF
ncbi:MAG TPA: single-stranded DNA-binding protein [Candidatus Saccharimonadia bacterium]|nr:single-stranded DNA-binding protein [Candidatus Saccharimonadia bacterium]